MDNAEDILNPKIYDLSLEIGCTSTRRKNTTILHFESNEENDPQMNQKQIFSKTDRSHLTGGDINSTSNWVKQTPPYLNCHQACDTVKTDTHSRLSVSKNENQSHETHSTSNSAKQKISSSEKDNTIVKYYHLVPQDIKRWPYDVMIVYCQADQSSAQTYCKQLTSVLLKGTHKVKAVLFDDQRIMGNKLENPSDIFFNILQQCSFIFLYLTNNFCQNKDGWINLSGVKWIQESIYNRKCVIIHTPSLQKIPMGLNTLTSLNYVGDFDTHKIQIFKLLEPNLETRIKREHMIRNNIWSWIEQNILQPQADGFQRHTDVTLPRKDTLSQNSYGNRKVQLVQPQVHHRKNPQSSEYSQISDGNSNIQSVQPPVHHRENLQSRDNGCTQISYDNSNVHLVQPQVHYHENLQFRANDSIQNSDLSLGSGDSGLGSSLSNDGGILEVNSTSSCGVENWYRTFDDESVVMERVQVHHHYHPNKTTINIYSDSDIKFKKNRNNRDNSEQNQVVSNIGSAKQVTTKRETVFPKKTTKIKPQHSYLDDGGCLPGNRNKEHEITRIKQSQQPKSTQIKEPVSDVDRLLGKLLPAAHNDHSNTNMSLYEHREFDKKLLTDSEETILKTIHLNIESSQSSDDEEILNTF